ncbi:MAG: CD225/dispanin family protein [Gammaproteobacteria bacterium]|nr:CD225/dispanin family protein [Gammaproteobacteria bacterium]
MHCSNCGHDNTPAGANCTNCGAALATAPATGQGPAPAAPPPREAAPPKPPNHLVWAILATLLCCLPTGIAAIVFAAQVDGKYASGDYAGALRSSANAKTWSWVSLGLGLVFGALYFMFAVIGVLADAGY